MSIVNTFDQWIIVFIMEVRKKGYSGEIDQEDFRYHFDGGAEPEDSAAAFIDGLSNFFQ